MNPDTPHRDDLDPATAALAALYAAHRSLFAVIDRELRAALGLSLAEAEVLATLYHSPDGRQQVRGVFSATQLEKQLGQLVPAEAVAHTFAQIEAALVR